jgi:hypothetical protein
MATLRRLVGSGQAWILRLVVRSGLLTGHLAQIILRVLLGQGFDQAQDGIGGRTHLTLSPVRPSLVVLSHRGVQFPVREVNGA